MRRRDIISLLFLFTAVIFIFYPVFYLSISIQTKRPSFGFLKITAAFRLSHLKADISPTGFLNSYTAPSIRLMMSSAPGCLINAGYNFRREFLYPLTNEYAVLKNFISINYRPEISTIYFIRPPEDAFVKRYGIVPSWDEFGVPSTAKYWTREALVKQIIFEKTGNRVLAEKIRVESWPGNDAFFRSGKNMTNQTLLINAGELLLKAHG
ncbi:MAG: hypothetical protein Q8926_12580 [Bacteroidota bacterium]|nr:hypothetical protein [Bacteroidota bacterium]